MWELNGKLVSEASLGLVVVVVFLVLCFLFVKICTENQQGDPALAKDGCLNTCCKSCLLACLHQHYPPPVVPPLDAPPPINTDPIAPPPSPLCHPCTISHTCTQVSYLNSTIHFHWLFHSLFSLTLFLLGFPAFHYCNRCAPAHLQYCIGTPIPNNSSYHNYCRYNCTCYNPC